MSDNLPADDIVPRYAQEYEWRADEGDYTPTEAERALLEDFGNGLLSEVEDRDLARIAALEAQIARLTAEPAVDEVDAVWNALGMPDFDDVRDALTAFLERRMKGC